MWYHQNSQFNSLSEYVVINRHQFLSHLSQDITEISINHQIIKWSELLHIRHMTNETFFAKYSFIIWEVTQVNPINIKSLLSQGKFTNFTSRNSIHLISRFSFSESSLTWVLEQVSLHQPRWFLFFRYSSKSHVTFFKLSNYHQQL